METEVLSESDIIHSDSDVVRTVGSEVTMGVASSTVTGDTFHLTTTTDR